MLKQRIVLFLIFLALLTTLAYLVFPVNGAGMLPSFLIMWSPGLAALFAALLSRYPFKEFGWHFSFKWIAVGWLIPVIYAAAAYGTIWIIGWGEVPNPVFLERARMTLGIEGGSNARVIILAFFYISVAGLFPSMLFSLGEELGWRGFLVPVLNARYGLLRAGLISSVIWAVWHLPGIISGDYGDASTPISYRLLCFFITVLSSGMILAWLRMRSSGIWPAVVFHATHNGVIQMFFDRITLPNSHTDFFSGEFGIALAFTTLAMALFLFRRPLKNLETKSTSL
ncbi:MAG: CPBP family intramembrane glutamic endopeptidase [Bacteroidota bacterium]